MELKPRGKPKQHGHAVKGDYTPTYQTWQSMWARCRYIHRDKGRKYAARGIRVCDRWQSFEAFLGDMGERPDGRTLDRIDNDGNYEPKNCRWATPIEQARNRRNKRLTYQTAFEVALARLSGEPCNVIATRYGISESLPREIVAGRTWKDASKAAHAAWNTRTPDEGEA